MEVAAISGQPWAGTNESLPEELMQHIRIECSYVLCQKCFCTCFCRWRQEFFGMRATYKMTAVQGKQWDLSGVLMAIPWTSHVVLQC